jgi:1-acyl-sn-glycerol-3-phosphate acyltransferase
LSRNVVRIYARLMLKLDLVWQSPLPAGPKLIVANHPSMTDPFLLGLLSRQPLHILIIDNPFYVPVFGAYLRKSGHVPVVLEDGRAAFEQARRLLEAGRSVALFPEGWVSPQQGGFNPPRTGAARLALLTSVPVVPVGIYLPREQNRIITANINDKPVVGYWYLRGPYSMTVGQPLCFEGDVADYERVISISNNIMRHIISLAHESERRTTGRNPPVHSTINTQDVTRVSVRMRGEK